jgi:hypothetical protein
MEAKQLMGRFFELVDTSALDSGNRLAEEVFTDDGVMIATAGTSNGTDGIYPISLEPS